MNDFFHKRKTIDGVKKLKKITKSTILILEEAEKLGIRWEKIPYTDLFKLEYKQKIEYLHAQIPPATTEFAYYCCKNKRVAKNILEKAGISVSKGYLIKRDDKKKYNLKLFKDLKKPLVVKPVADIQGNNVYLNINTEEEYLDAIQAIYTFHGKKKVNILVEQMFDGDEYRILASKDKILSVIKRLPANVIGDGKSTIEELIKIKNKDPIRQKVATYKDIVIDEALNNFLKSQSLNIDSILDPKKRVFLRAHSALDISLGGDTIDVTDEIHPTVRKIVQTVMDSIPGLAISGIDFMTKDIESEQTADKYRIIEINSSPSLDWNEFPLEGPRRRIVYEFLKIIFPELD